MATKTFPDIAYIRECLDTDSEVFTWLSRPSSHFGSLHEFGRWNTRFAGKVAGTIDAGGYVRIRIDDQYYRAHRLRWLLVYGHPVPDEIDHIDGDKTNNRISNLRAATKPENGANSRVRPDNKTGFKGVFRLRDGRYRAKINVRYRQIHLGYFATLKEAAEARRAAAERLLGEFARH